MNIDDRLRAAGNALREGSAAQVDAASGLREILLHTDPADEPIGSPAPSPPPPANRLLGRPQRRLALAVNLLLVLILGVGLGVVFEQGRDAAPAAEPPVTTVAAVTTSTAAATQTVTVVPQECLDAAELADEVISKLNRDVKDERLFLALRDYTIASQACRREAAP